LSGDLGVMWENMKEILKYTGLITLLIGLVSLIVKSIIKMEIIKIKNVFGEFAVNNNGTIFKIKADISHIGYSNIHVIDIILTINHVKKMRQCLEGDIIQRKDNNSIVISPRALNFSNKVDCVPDFNCILTPEKNNLKILGSYFNTDNQFHNSVLEGVLEIKTNPNIIEKILTWAITSFINKKKYKFQFRRVKEIKPYPGEIIIQLETKM